MAAASAAAAAEIEREIQQLTTRLQRLRTFLAEVILCRAAARKSRKKAAKRGDPRAVVRANQHYSVLQHQYVTMSARRDEVRDRLAALKQQARQ